MRKLSGGSWLLAAFIVVSLAAVAGGFLIIGPPSEQRLRAFDKKRSEHLIQMAKAIDSHWNRNGSLPAALDSIANPWASELRDPETGEPYGYEVTGADRYKVCAVFALADDEPADSPWEHRFSTHGKGLHCIELTAGGAGQLFGTPPMGSR